MTIAIIISTILGPVIGVVIAALFSRLENKRTAAINLFVTLLQHVLDYQRAIYSYLSDVAFHEGDPKIEQIRELDAVLVADMLMCSLLFGDELSEKTRQAIKELQQEVDNILAKKPKPPIGPCQGRINPLAEQVSREMKPLHDSLSRFGVGLRKK